LKDFLPEVTFGLLSPACHNSSKQDGNPVFWRDGKNESAQFTDAAGGDHYCDN